MDTLTRERGLLRVATAGSVDDGKSTLLGRLMYDTKTVMDDHLAAARRASERYGDAAQLAMLTDGLRAEREQGITIDVAYRFFATPVRSFVLADTPGHEQYTRNMVTGASSSDVAIVLVDARNGVVAQSRRHAYIAALTGIGHLVVAVNKMDLVDWDEEAFRLIAKELATYVEAHAPDLPVTAVPVSALHGDNVVDPSPHLDWYAGPTLLGLLERLDVRLDDDRGDVGARLAVQWVIRPQRESHHDYRGYAGRLVGGELRPGDEVVVLPSGRRSRVHRLDTYDGPLDVAVPGQAVTVLLDDDIDVSRGDTLVAVSGVRPAVGTTLDVDVCWMIDQPLVTGARLWLKHGTRQVRAIVTELLSVVDLETSQHLAHPGEIPLNSVGRVRLRLATPVVADTYDVNRATGRGILVDERTNATAAACMIRSVTDA